MALNIFLGPLTQPATQQLQYAVASPKHLSATVGLPKKRTNMSLSCNHRDDFAKTFISVRHESRLAIVEAYSHEEGVTDNDDDKDQNLLCISYPLDPAEVIQRLELQDYLDENELHKHLESLGNIVWELRLHFDYKYRDGNFIVIGTPIHGLWKSHVKNGRVVSDLDSYIYSKTKTPAIELSNKAYGIPTLLAKLKTMWKPTNHTSTAQNLVAHEMAKHGFLSIWYVVLALEAARPFFDENGNSILLKWMEEMDYVEGIFNCLQFQDDFAKRFGRKILVTYEDKKVKKRLYPKELGILFGGYIEKMNYLLPEDVGPSPTEEFFLDGIYGSGTK